MLGSDKVMQLSFVERWFSSGNFSTQVGAATLKYSNIFFTLLSNFLSSKRLGFLVIIALQWWTCANQLLIPVFVVHAWTCRPEFCCSLQPRLTKQNKKATSINCYLLTKRYPQALAQFTVTRFRNDALLVKFFLVDTTVYAEFSRPHQNAGKRWHSMKKQHNCHLHMRKSKWRQHFRELSLMHSIPSSPFFGKGGKEERAWDRSRFSLSARIRGIRS